MNFPSLTDTQDIMVHVRNFHKRTLGPSPPMFLKTEEASGPLTPRAYSHGVLESRSLETLEGAGGSINRVSDELRGTSDAPALCFNPSVAVESGERFGT